MILRPLIESDRAEWDVLWRAYQEFYRAQIPPEVTELTWLRFHDAKEPMFAMGAVLDGRLVAIVHYLFHRSCWSAGPYCYLQDLYTAAEYRNRGIARALIEATYEAARAAGASRVYWLTHETNADAMHLYDKVAEKSGFLQYRKLIR